MTRIPGDLPNEGRARAEDRRNTQSRPTQEVFHPYAIGSELACPSCGNRVEVRQVGGGEIRCCGAAMDRVSGPGIG
ncbi:MAG: hypothetical protein K6V73_10975 [Firmicutes bacterium]|nr:hypothetical protein [Bacillota bacterium]